MQFLRHYCMDQVQRVPDGLRQKSHPFAVTFMVLKLNEKRYIFGKVMLRMTLNKILMILLHII